MGILDGKVAIVTGGSRGHGAAHVRKMVEEGAKVVFTDLRVEEGEALAKELGENAKFIKHDVSNADDWKNVIDETESTFGPVNILVNNAAIVILKNIEELAEADFRKVIDVNLVSVFLGMKAVLPSMKKTGNGSIINISSIGGFHGTPSSSAYDSSKFAVRGITKSAALEFAEHGIRVNSVHPGSIDSTMVKIDPGELTKEMNEQVEKAKQSIPLKRMGSTEEVANLVVYLASDKSSYSTGSEFIVDGGLMAGL